MESDMLHWHFDYVRLAWDSGFFFGNTKQNEKLDYSIIGLVDIEKISRDRDYATVEKHIPTIINFTLEDELSKILEPTFVKLFKLSQLSIEYLQFCKKYLDNTVILLKKELNDRQATCDNLRKEGENMTQYVGNLKQKNKDLKSHLQLLEAQNVVSFDCPHCNKIFSTPAYMEAHVNRRHNDSILESAPTTNMQIEADKLQLEIKELKERLNSSEKFVQVEHSSEAPIVHKNDIHNKLELHRQHVESELEAIRVVNALKYEQLSETMIKRLEESQNPQIQTPELVVHDKIESINNKIHTSTQTESNNRCVDSNVNTEIMALESTHVDVRHEIEGIKDITEQHLQEFTKALEHKVSTNLAQLETKLESFLSKCSSLKNTPVFPEKITHPTNKELSPIRQPVTVISNDRQEPKPAPRRQQEVHQIKTVASKTNTPPVRPKPRSKVLSCTENTMHFKTPQATKQNTPQITFIKNPQKYISSSSSGSSDSETESDSSSSDDSAKVSKLKSVPEALKPSIKISNTSTLRNRSVTSLRKAVDVNVTQGLSAELETLLNQKLQSIGVSPDWTGIPKQSYEQAMEIINNQNKASMKNYPEYNKFQQSILLRLKDKVKQFLSNKKPISKSNHLRPIQQKVTTPKYKNIISKQQQSEPSNSTPSTSKNPQRIDSPVKQITPKAKTAISVGKKRVLFDLDTEESSASVSSIENQPPPEVQVVATGSTTSVASSILDGLNHKETDGLSLKVKDKDQKKKLDEQAKKSVIIEEDISDWDVSDLAA